MLEKRPLHLPGARIHRQKCLRCPAAALHLSPRPLCASRRPQVLKLPLAKGQRQGKHWHSYILALYSPDCVVWPEVMHVGEIVLSRAE